VILRVMIGRFDKMENRSDVRRVPMGVRTTDALEVLAAMGATRSQEWMRATAMPHTSFDRALVSLKKNGMVHKPRGGRTAAYIVTPIGYQTLIRMMV
jgi:predicted transcriptional regulator